MENERLLSELFAQYDIGKETRTDFLKRLNAARDRWWVKTVDALMDEPPCYAPDIEPCTELNCEVWLSKPLVGE